MMRCERNDNEFLHHEQRSGLDFNVETFLSAFLYINSRVFRIIDSLIFNWVARATYFVSQTVGLTQRSISRARARAPSSAQSEIWQQR